MSFASITFAVFFCIVLALLWLTRSPRLEQKDGGRAANTLRQGILLVASYVFYGWWDARFCLLMLGLTVAAYCAGVGLDGGKHRKLWLVIGVGVPLAALGLFKYFNFFLGAAQSLIGFRANDALHIILPVGISFYTFQAISYVMDVARKEYAAERSFGKLALYIAFFPQLVAGPIVRAGDFLPQLHENRRPTLRGLEIGVQIFLFGLFKKVVLADHLSVFVDDVFGKPLAFHSATVLLAVVSYSLQIYLDFSGYSDMAIGCGKCLGYDLPPNFNLPYLARNISEFWKRWHISLSTWLQEYLYIPLGGNRRGNQYVNLMLTMLLGGFWHGASWTFLAWGGLHGAALCIHKIYRRLRGEKCGNAPLTQGISTLGTYIFVCLGWVLFRAERFSVAGQIFGKLFFWSDGIVQPFVWSFVAIAFVAICTLLACRHSGKAAPSGYYPHMPLTQFWPLVAVFAGLGLTIALAYTGGNPFIYFQF